MRLGGVVASNHSQEPNGNYTRKLHNKAGEVTLQVPRLRSLPFETQIIERYKRREASVEEALVEMYLTGISVRRVEEQAYRGGTSLPLPGRDLAEADLGW